MEKEQIIDSDIDLLLPKTHKSNSKTHSSLNRIQYKDQKQEILDSPCKESSKQKCQGNTQQLRGEKGHFIKQLLKSLGYSNTLSCFQKQCRAAQGDKNPQEASNRKRIANQKKKQLGEINMSHLIQGSLSFEEILSCLEEIYEGGGVSSEHIAQKMHEISLRDDFEKKVKCLFSQKREAIIPKTKSIEIVLQGKEVRFIDVNAEEKLCLLDSDDFLQVVSAKQESKPLKVDEGRDIIYLKWINQNTIFSIGTTGKVTVFTCSEKEVRVKESIPLRMPNIKRVNLHVLKYPELPDKQYVRILLKNENGEFIACQVVVNKDEIKFTGGTLFQTKYNFRAFNVIKVPKYMLNKNVIEGEIEHYYGLTENNKSIVKFDTTVKNEAVLWTSSRKIDSINNSQCRFFLLMLLVESREKRKRQQGRTRKQATFEYEFVKMNGHGCIIQRVNLDSQSPLLPQGFTFFSLSRVRVMSPDWLVCFDWDDKIVYASAKSGKILYVAEMEEEVRVIGVGPSNCIVCSADEKIFLLSPSQSEKRKLFLQRSPTVRDRESLILRLTRNGIPETLLQLLQQLRNNQVQIIES